MLEIVLHLSQIISHAPGKYWLSVQYTITRLFSTWVISFSVALTSIYNIHQSNKILVITQCTLIYFSTCSIGTHTYTQRFNMYSLFAFFQLHLSFIPRSVFIFFAFILFSQRFLLSSHSSHKAQYTRNGYFIHHFTQKQSQYPRHIARMYTIH